jgi:hypothetical protein
MSTETITWHAVAEQLPDADETVLLCWGPGDLDCPCVETGWLDDEEWRLAFSGEAVRAPEWWAHMPAGPGANDQDAVPNVGAKRAAEGGPLERPVSCGGGKHE